VARFQNRVTDFFLLNYWCFDKFCVFTTSENWPRDLPKICFSEREKN